MFLFRLRFCCYLLLLSIMCVFPVYTQHATAQELPNINALVLRTNVISFRVRTAGIVTIPASRLADVGWSLATIAAANIHVYRDAHEVAIEVLGGADGHLGTADALRLLVTANDSRWTDAAVYWLAYDDQPGLRVTTPTMLPATYTWEQDTHYESRFASIRGDRWFATELRADAAPYTTTLTLPDSLPTGSILTVGVHSVVKRTKHQLLLSTGTRTIGVANWDDETTTAPISLTVTLSTALSPGALPLTVRLTSGGAPTDAVLLDRISAPTLALTAPTLPTPTLTAQTPLDLRQGPNANQRGGSFLIITHASLQSALAPLIAAHRSRGDTVAVVDTQTAYDAWSDGAMSPDALRALIRTAVASWQPPPRAVLLVGAGSVKLRMGQQDTIQRAQAHTWVQQARSAAHLQIATVGEDLPERTNMIPPYLVATDPLRGEIACDTCYTRLDGDDPITDALPDLPIGRLPVRTLAEAQIVIAKTVTALTAPPQGAWQQRALVLSDNDRDADGTPDPAGSFTATAETGVSALPRGLDVHRFYYAPDRATAGPYDRDVSHLRCQFFRQIDGGSSNDTACPARSTADDPGAALLMYIGHGSPWQWAATELDAEVPYLYYLYDADGRHNEGRLPILLSMTCLTGDWANAILETTDERLLLHDGGGIVAALSSSGQGVNTSHARLLRGLLPRLYAASGARSLGVAHLAGLTTVSVGGQDTDLIYSFSILGDPDVSVPFVPRSTVYLPLAAR